MRTLSALRPQPGRPPSVEGRPGSPGCRFPFAGAASRGLRGPFDPIRVQTLIPEDKVWKSSADHLWMVQRADDGSGHRNGRRLRLGNGRVNSDGMEASRPWFCRVYTVKRGWHSPNHLTRRSIIGLSDIDYGGAGGSTRTGGLCCGLGRDGADWHWHRRGSVSNSALTDRGSIVEVCDGDGFRSR
jgi:hypothetical protein